MFYDNYHLISSLYPKNHLANTQLWLIYDTHAQKNRVIKQLLPNFNPTQYQQFIQEFQVYQQLKKLNPAPCAYFFQLMTAHLSADQNWLVLDYYQGKNLQQALIENCLTFNQKIAYLIDACSTIEILHSQGFIHCDIKPSNLFISESPPDSPLELPLELPLKLLDFGLARPIDRKSQSGITAGTPAYMSPEQFTGEVITYQSDYYSLGIVIYEILLGHKPFSAKPSNTWTLQDWAIAHCQTPIPTLMDINSPNFLPTNFSLRIRVALQSVFNLLLAKFPQNRPKDLSTIISRLKNLEKI